ncbi:hypothetical protein [Pseudomonas sp. MH10]|uniref:hypothetical protein n=1 Tax=Pseudomonas sp. MH10 TaxID=3048627 RepID=UPI003A0FC81D
MQYLILVLSVTALFGCVVPSSYSKTVSVTKDADGRVIQTVESETVVQGSKGYPLRLEHIKGVQAD